MLKKFMATALLVCAIPAMASASWFLSTQVRSAGGQISSANGLTQDVTSGTIFKSYTSADQGLQTITFTPATGYGLELSTSSNLTTATNLQNYILLQQKSFDDATGTYTTATLPLTPGANGVYTTQFTPAQNSTVTVAVNYKVARVLVTAAMTGGNVSPSAVGNITYGYTLKNALNFYFSPAKNCQITSITGLPDGLATISYVNGSGTTVSGLATAGSNAVTAGVNQRVRVQFPVGYVVTNPIQLQGAASNPNGTLSAGLAQTITTGSATTLTATGTLTGLTWSYVSGPSNTTTPVANSNVPLLVAGPALVSPSASSANPFSTGVLTTPGQYVFKAVAGSLSSTVNVNVVAVKSQAAQNQCQFCHTANGIGTQYNADGSVKQTAAALYSNWSTSIHGQSLHAVCSACHVGTASGAHPGTVNAATVDRTTFVVTNGANGMANGALFCTYCHNGAHPVPHPTTGLDATQTCQNCHTTGGTGDAHQLQPAGTVQTALDNCTNCHNDAAMVGLTPANVNASCASCHTSSSVHAFQATSASTKANDCVGCHNVIIDHPGSLVNDNGTSNSGVRAITGANGEFDASTRTNTAGYRSHHIYNGTGIDPQNAQCIMCHLEGKVGPNRTVVLDPTKHMFDNQVHLRSGKLSITGGSAEVAWNPASPDHSGMDNFCMSCHNAAGAVDAFANVSSALKGMTPIAGATAPSATNPFGDKLQNAYDGLVRPNVVAVYEQFDTTNVSHHAVRGKKYTGAYRAGNPNNVTTTGHVASTYPATTFTQYSGATNATIHKNATGTLQTWQYFGSYSTAGNAAGYDANLSSGSRKTLYEANLFTAAYTTLNGSTLGDDSTLHCGDCHSVGQWMSGSAKAVNADGVTIQATTIAIGAHGSKNEYMLRTSNGSDALHMQGSTTNGTVAYATNGTYVCYLCHKQQAYADNNYFKTDAGVGVTGYRNHGGLHNSAACESSAWNSAGKIGYAARVGSAVAGNGGSVFGYTCANCHSSGNQIFGGIHGSSSADGSAKNLRFLSYSTDGTDVIGKTLAGGYGYGLTGAAALAARSYSVEHDTLNAVAKLPYRFMGGTSLRYNGGATASKWEAKTLNGMHREGCYNLATTSDNTKLWNTTAPQTALPGSPVGNAVLNNGGNDSAIGASDYSTRTAQNSGTAGWGACNHHQGASTGSSTAPTRSIQRPLVY